MAKQNYARIVDGVVFETHSLSDGGTITEVMHPDVAEQFIACPAKVEAGWTYDGKTFTAPVPSEITRDDLTNYAAQKRWQVETGDIAIEGMQIATDRESQAMISSAFQVASVTGQAIKFKTASGFVELSPEQMQGIALTVAAHVQASFAAEADVVGKIEAGEIESVAQIDRYPWPGSIPA